MKTRASFAILAAALLCGFASLAASEPDIDSLPPVVVKTLPEAGTAKVPPGECEVKVTFSKEMQDHSWSWSTAWNDSTPDVIGEPRYEADHKTCVLKVKLEANKTYGWWLNSQKFHNFRDVPGHAAVPYLLTFKTTQEAPAQEPVPAPAAPKITTDQVIVEDLALEMLVAIRDKDDAALQKLAVDRPVAWRESLPHFALEMRERFHQMTGKPFDMKPVQSLVESGRAVVKCTGDEKLKGIYLVLFFVKTGDGSRNWLLRNSPPSRPLSEFLKEKPAAARGTSPRTAPVAQTSGPTSLKTGN